MGSPSTDATLDATLAPDAGVEVGESERAATAGSSTRREWVELGRGEQLGRYLILDELGSGAMGKVYAAYDPELDRKLAIKLLHRRERSGSEGSSGGAMRLQREAQAMAKLSHRNVVAVHDVGLHEGQVFVAMEYVEGQTLRGWMDAGPHPWSEVLARFGEAGRGLGAAHHAGLVHRDFKPANVLLGDDGRVRVADFGLARQTGSEVELREHSDFAAQLPVSASTQLTRTGAIVGTPAYMAPEQFAGATLDARSDQFSFCVALWEALWGERPFAGDSAAAIGFAIMQGKLREPPASPRVPGWIRKVLERGLASDANARWPNMESLLRALDRDPARRRRQGAAIVVGLAGLVGLALAPQLLRDPPEPLPPPPPLCEGASEVFAEVWGPAQREQLHARYAKLGPKLGPEAEIHVVGQLDSWASGWTEAWTDACAATRIRGEQSDEMLDQRMLCLERRKTRFGTFVAELDQLDDAQLRNATARVGSIGDVDDCSDPEAMHARIPPPAEPEQREVYEALLAKLDSVSTKIVVGRYEAAQSELEPVYAKALASGHPSLIAEARHTRGRLLSDIDDPGAEAELEQAHAAALAAGMFEIAAHCARMLASSIVTADARIPEAARWLQIAEGLAAYIDDERVDLNTLNVRARMARYSGDVEGALAANRELLDRTRALYGPDHVETARVHFNLSAVLFDVYALEEAVAEVAKAREIWAQTLGPNDPRSLKVLAAEAIFSGQMGRLPQAVALFEELLERKLAIFGDSSHTEIAEIQFNYGSTLIEIGDPRAIDMLREALTTYQRSYGADGVSAAQCEANLAIALAVVAKRTDEAHARLDAALEIIEARRPAGHPERLTGYIIRLRMYEQDDDWASVLREGERLRERLVSAGQDRGLLMAELRVHLALAELGEGRPAAALTHIEAAHSLAVDNYTSPRDTAHRFMIGARALLELGRADEAEAAIAEARAAFASLGEIHEQDWIWRQLEAWPERPTDGEP